jgi:hypothetical protein
LSHGEIGLQRSYIDGGNKRSWHENNIDGLTSMGNQSGILPDAIRQQRANARVRHIFMV